MSKYIDADVLIKGMNELLKSPWADDRSLFPRNLVIKEALGTVKDLCIDDMPAADVEPVEKWIPCSERLPEPGTKVLIYKKWEGKSTHEVYFDVGIARAVYGGIWVAQSEWYEHDDVIAWRPLIELPKMDGGSSSSSW